jgi:hypothetical protein
LQLPNISNINHSFLAFKKENIFIGNAREISIPVVLIGEKAFCLLNQMLVSHHKIHESQSGKVNPKEKLH